MTSRTINPDSVDASSSNFTLKKYGSRLYKLSTQLMIIVGATILANDISVFYLVVQ